MKFSPLGILVVLVGAVAGIGIWVAGYFGLPNQVTHRNLAANPPIESSVGANNATTTGGSSNTTTGGTGGSVTLVTLPKKDASQIHLVDTSMPGYQLFEHTCANCHGASGEGGFGPAIYAIGKYWNKKQLLDFVTKGYGNMPARGTLSSDTQVQQVVDWLIKQRG
ncbi:MAG: cytochrome c [Alicyclobacillus sp.]|nr:cytochrome c [Alicyclobacillus sp.]